MKKYVDGIIIVEGKSDVAFLSNFIDAEFVTTNGSDVPNETIEYLQEASKTKKLYVLTDPDSPGKRIRDVLDENIDGLNHCFISKEKSIKHNKVGVAEGDINEILESLNYALSTNKNESGSLTSSDLYELGLLGQEKSFEMRNLVSKKLHLGFCNGKTFLKRLNYLGVKKEDLAKIL